LRIFAYKKSACFSNIHKTERLITSVSVLLCARRLERHNEVYFDLMYVNFELDEELGGGKN